MTRVEHVYVHVPFCPRVCPYCSFYVQPADNRLVPPLIASLLAELKFYHERLDLAPRTVFLGGGTPSALATAPLRELVTALAAGRSVDEFTIEMNPTTVSLEKARMLRDLGVNRISLGAQSFDAAALATLGRQHTPDLIERSYELLRHAGFNNINVDLMFGIPGQSDAAWEETLARALALQPEHLSAYCLTYEEDTPFFEKLQRGEWTRDVEAEASLYRNTMSAIEAGGLLQYEVSNFARPGRESAHNLAIWRGRDYLGLGPGAVSTVAGRRWKNVPDTARYFTAQSAPGAEHYGPVTDEETLSPALQRRERIIFGLRTREGVVMPDAEFVGAFTSLEEAGYAEMHEGRWRLTREGWLRADAVAELFL